MMDTFERCRIVESIWICFTRTLVGIGIGLCLMVGSLYPRTVDAAIEVYDFNTPEQEAQFQTLTHLLRCPKCQNNTIAESNAGLAHDLRQQVYEMTVAGQDQQAILDFMVARYGHFVVYEPPMTLSTIILWLGPLGVVLMGGGVIVYRHYRSSDVTHWDQDKELQWQALFLKEPEPCHGQQSDQRCSHLVTERSDKDEPSHSRGPV